MAKDELKPTKRLDLSAAMVPMAKMLDEWALVNEKGVIEKVDKAAAAEARQLAGEIRLCLGQLELTDNLADGEAATKRLQALRGLTLEFFAKHKA